MYATKYFKLCKGILGTFGYWGGGGVSIYKLTYTQGNTQNLPQFLLC
jgi:hypothetical protein